MPFNTHTIPPGEPRAVTPQDFAFAREQAELIRNGVVPNAKIMRPLIGAAYTLRFWAFGEPPRCTSLVSRHAVYRTGLFICPRHTDPALGGITHYPCPLCAAIREDALPRWLNPTVKVEMWCYVVELGRTDGDGAHHTDTGTLIDPCRLQLKFPAAEIFFKVAYNNPQVGDAELGTDFELRIQREDDWTLTPVRTGPLTLSPVPLMRARQLLHIAARLGDPFISHEATSKRGMAALTAGPVQFPPLERLESCRRILNAYKNAPNRDEDRFWTELQSGSRPTFNP